MERTGRVAAAGRNVVRPKYARSNRVFEAAHEKRTKTRAVPSCGDDHKHPID